MAADDDGSGSAIQPSTALVVRSAVPPMKDYSECRDILRHDFCYACAYCTMSEVEAAGVGFQIDHYDPDKQLRISYDNLMWSCAQCNRYKSDYFPTAEQARKGEYVLRPDREDPRPHFETSRLLWKGTTPTGTFNIEQVELNRPQLVTLRSLRTRLAEAQDFIAFGVREIITTSLDVVLPQYRSVLLEWKKRVTLAEEDATQGLAEYIRSAVRSPLLDRTPGSPRRRSHLASVDALAPNVERRPRSLPRRRRRRRRR